MKKFLAILLCAIMLLPTIPTTVGAEISYYNHYENLYYTKYDDHIEITGCDESAISIDIPAEIDGLPVTSIGYRAFECCESLMSVTIPNSVTSIGWCSFYDCSRLTSITIPSSVTRIGDLAFYDTAYYNDGSNWQNGVLYIDNCLIETNDELPSDYAINNGTRVIADSAFFGCNGLTSVTIPNSVTIIGDYAFSGCGLTSVTIPNSVTSIGNWTFAHCNGLTSVTIPSSVMSIGTGAFYDTAYYNDGSNWQNGVLYIDNCLIEVNDELPSDYAIKNGTRVIADSVFNWRNDLTSVTIPNSVKSIGDSAFSNCNGLTSVAIPNSVTSIGDGTFYGCESLTSVTIGTGVTSIGDRAFVLCYRLTSVTIPDSVTSIGEYAFEACDSLTSITIPNSVISIGRGAFDWCDSLTSITVDNQNQYYCSIDGNLFDKSQKNLIQYAVGKQDSQYTIPSGVTSIGDIAFGECYSLKSVTIPNSVKSIGYSAFADCSSLTSITIPNSVTSIGNNAFDFCDSLTDVYYGGSEADWQRIDIGSYNKYLTNATIHYNSSGGGSTEPTPDSGASTMPADINNITINYKGTAYGYFEVTDEGGNALKNKSVSYSIDGGAAKTGVTDGYGYLCVQISGITKSRDYSIKISGSGVRPASGVLSVTVKPLEFKSAYEAILTKGASAGLGIGIGGSIGNLGAEAQAAEIGASGSNKKGFSYSQERKNGKTHLEVTAKENTEAALKAKVGLWAGASAAVAGAEISAGDIHGSAKYGNELSVGFEDDDFNFKDSGDLTRLAKFMVNALLENMDSNVATRWLLEKLAFKPDTYEKGSTAAVSAGAGIGSVKLKSGDQEFAGVTLGGIDGDAVWSHSTKTSKDNTISRKSSVAADAGVKLGDVNLFKKDGGKFGSGTSVWKKTFVDNKVQFLAENNKNGDLTSLGVTWTDDESNSIFWNKKSVSNTRSITYSGDAADKVASSYGELRDFADGRKGFFSVAQMVKANAAMINSDQKGIFSASVKKTKGIDLNASASVQLFLKLGGELGISGTESYSYETENGIYENNTVYTQAKNDIDSAVEREFFGVEDAFSAAANYMGNLIADCWETVSGFIDNAVNSAVEAGKAAVKKVGDAVTGWKVSITKAVEDISPFSIMAVDSEVSLFSTSSVATTVGSPYIVSVEDENGNEITDLSSNPLLLVLEYTDEELAAAGVTDIGDVAVYRWDEDKCVYVCLGGTLDEADKSLSLEITKTGQYILAADNCPPAVTEFKASGGGISPEITAIVSDMSSIANFEMTIDGTTVVDNANLGDYYDYTTAEFVYPTNGLSSGSHTAVIYASDTSGNELVGGMSLAFTVDTDVPTINSVTKISEQVTNETEVSADVTGENISAVYLNVEETDARGRSVRSSYEMTAQNETYSAQIQNITQGSQVKIWVTAYNTNGNKSETEKQTALSVPVGNETAVMITSVKDNTVTVTTVNGENVVNAHILLAIYDDNGILKQAEVKDYSPNLVFNNKDLSEGSIKAYLWDKNLRPLSAVAEFDI